jgi:hypothetical protein
MASLHPAMKQEILRQDNILRPHQSAEVQVASTFRAIREEHEQHRREMDEVKAFFHKQSDFLKKKIVLLEEDNSRYQERSKPPSTDLHHLKRLKLENEDMRHTVNYYTN